MKRTNLIVWASALFLTSSLNLCYAQTTNSGVVSHTPSGPPHVWTREEMLLAQPMPMSGEIRKFVFSHKSVQKLNEWNLDDFKSYTKPPIGRRLLFEEGRRWIDICAMVKAQAKFAQDFVAGKAKLPKPNSKPKAKLGKPIPPKSQSVDGAPGVSPGGPGADAMDDVPSMNLSANLSKEQNFLHSAADLVGSKGEANFIKLKKLRLDISKYCKQLDVATETAKKKGKSKELEHAMNTVLWE